MEPLSEEKDIVNELQIGDILEDNELIIIPKDTGVGEISPAKVKAD